VVVRHVVVLSALGVTVILKSSVVSDAAKKSCQNFSYFST
jgi:hypothetical protein